MSLLRLILLYLLCLAIPLQGIAGIAVAEPPCPMEQATSGDAMSASNMPSVMQDCCNDADTSAKTDKACKPGQQCQSSGQYSALALNNHSTAPVQAVRIACVVFSVHSVDSSSLWRPPSQI